MTKFSFDMVMAYGIRHYSILAIYIAVNFTSQKKKKKFAVNFI